jgi:hypothetical protein
MRTCTSLTCLLPMPPMLNAPLQDSQLTFRQKPSILCCNLV